MLAPPQSLQLCLRLSPASGAFSPCSNASSACAAGVTRPCSALRAPVISGPLIQTGDVFQKSADSLVDGLASRCTRRRDAANRAARRPKSPALSWPFRRRPRRHPPAAFRSVVACSAASRACLPWAALGKLRRNMIRRRGARCLESAPQRPGRSLPTSPHSATERSERVRLQPLPRRTRPALQK